MGDERLRELRGLAERRLKEAEKHPENASSQQILQLVHEFQVYQTELELQNEALRRTRSEIERSGIAFQDLWDNSPVGLLTLDGNDRITKINRAGVKLFSSPEHVLLGEKLSSLVDPDEQVGFPLLLEGLRESRSSLKGTTGRSSYRI